MIFPFYGGQPCPPWGSSPISFLQRVRAISTPYKKKKPLLHIWSLSVEEQYYFVFPILLLMVVRKSWRTQFAFLITLCVFSILASFIPTSLDKYYLPHLRACEMLIGSLTAVWMQYRQQQGLDTGKPYAAAGALAFRLRTVCLPVAYTEKTAYFPGPAAIHSLFGRRRIHLFQSI